MFNSQYVTIITELPTSALQEVTDPDGSVWWQSESVSDHPAYGAGNCRLGSMSSVDAEGNVKCSITVRMDHLAAAISKLNSMCLLQQTFEIMQ